MKKEISSRQLGILIFISMLGFKLTFLPASLYKYARTDGIISFFLALIIDLICFVLVFITFLRNEDVSFSAFLEKRIGMFFAKIVYFLFFIFFIFKLFFLISAGIYFVKEAIYEEMEGKRVCFHSTNWKKYNVDYILELFYRNYDKYIEAGKPIFSSYEAIGGFFNE